ncbi:hypothetical protein BKH28_09770 [Actinomyces oris]|uniref:Uncharacterized protein n=1 Tax=Actinomyces oris TaxID=544580 RepID=A0A1Q8VJL2_9ACTO|nr:hypothetical protein BKH28_09770 [Actinomyces oris]
MHPDTQRLRHEWHNILRSRIRPIRSGDTLGLTLSSRLSIRGRAEAVRSTDADRIGILISVDAGH